MHDLTITVAGPSSRALRQLQQMQGLTEVLDKANISEYSSEDDKHNEYQ
jgi:hypothetical protein